MDKTTIMKRDKLGFTGILARSFRIIAGNPRFLLFTLLASFPLFLSLLLFELLFQEALFSAVHTLLSHDDWNIRYHWSPMDRMIGLFLKHFNQYVSLGVTYLILVHPLDLLYTVLIVYHSSALYAGEALHSFRGLFLRPLKGSGFLGPLITSVYAGLLSALVALGLISLGMNSSMFESGWYQDVVLKVLFLLLFGGLFFALLMKYIDWRSVWNVGIVISVLEEKHGYIAIGVAAYIARGSRRRGFFLMSACFLWQLVLRSLCLYFVWGKKWGDGPRVGATVAQVLGVCLGNLMKWVIFMVYYCDCKKRFLEKKVDVEHGTSDEQK